MARPVYIVFAQAYSMDKDTDLLSVFQIVESIQIAPVPEPQEGEKAVFVRWQQFRMVAAWMIEPEKGDRYEDEYEFEFRLHTPDGATHLGGRGTFSFAAPEPRPVHRFPAHFDNPLPLPGPGPMRIEHRIRKAGAGEWLSQDYPVIVTEVPKLTTNGPPA
jgi:hypothetical protein